MYSEEIVTKIMNAYEVLRTKSRRERDERIREVYRRVPEIEEIDMEINQSGFSNTKNIMKDPQNSAAYNAAFRERLEQLEQRKQELLKAHKIDPGYSDYQYACADCRDTGFIGNKKCHCYEQKLIRYAYEDANLSELMQEQRFDTFSLQYYSARKLVDDGISERDMMEKTAAHCRMFCAQFDTYRKSLLFFGGTGVGKTFLSSAIANDLIQKNKTVIYIRATKLFNMYDDYKFSKTDGTYIKKLYECDLLIIDDLGTEFLSKTSVPFLFDLVNDRLAGNKKMIINTNLNMSGLAKAYSQRLVSRFYESFDIMQFYGDDIRVKKFKQGIKK